VYQIILHILTFIIVLNQWRAQKYRIGLEGGGSGHKKMINKTFLDCHIKSKNLGGVEHPNLFAYTCTPLGKIL